MHEMLAYKKEGKNGVAAMVIEADDYFETRRN
jgi:hypothetical protein